MSNSRDPVPLRQIYLKDDEEFFVISETSNLTAQSEVNDLVILRGIATGKNHTVNKDALDAYFVDTGRTYDEYLPVGDRIYLNDQYGREHLYEIAGVTESGHRDVLYDLRSIDGGEIESMTNRDWFERLATDLGRPYYSKTQKAP